MGVQDSCDVHGGREGIVGGLTHVDVIVGMDKLKIYIIFDKYRRMDLVKQKKKAKGHYHMEEFKKKQR